MSELWDLNERPERKPRISLSRSAIVQAALEIADTEGIEAISMQRVATELGFTKMSLYRHVANKDELLSHMIEIAVEEPPDLARTPGGWRERLEEFARLLAEVWRRHPWLPLITVGARMMGPREVGWIESAVAALAGTGLTGGERLACAFLIFGHVRNTQSMDTAGTQPWSDDGELAERIRARADLFPELSTALAAGTEVLDDNARRFGLDRILDGIAALVESRASQASGGPRTTDAAVLPEEPA